LILNFLGSDDERREDRERESARFVEARLDMREMGRDRESRIAVVVLSMEERPVRNCRRGEESVDEVER
jgi:hypothetical protein